MCMLGSQHAQLLRVYMVINLVQREQQPEVRINSWAVANALAGRSRSWKEQD